MSSASGTNPRRILVAGTSGVGKTTLAARIGDLLDIPHTELDALHHGPGWIPRAEFRDDVRALVAREEWITEWQYSSVRALLLSRAQLLVWLDLPVPLAMRRVVLRTIRRRVHRTVLWNGNIEPPLRAVFTDDEHILRWAWRTRHKYRRLDERLAVEAPHLDVVPLRSQRDVDGWLTTLGPA